jgi:hypothetical protein
MVIGHLAVGSVDRGCRVSMVIMVLDLCINFPILVFFGKLQLARA